jgi:hypothetical protein
VLVDLLLCYHPPLRVAALGAICRMLEMSALRQMLYTRHAPARLALPLPLTLALPRPFPLTLPLTLRLTLALRLILTLPLAPSPLLSQARASRRGRPTAGERSVVRGAGSLRQPRHHAGMLP